MAGGIGFNMFEATGYITSEQADWIAQGILRSTAGLLHGVGAGMAALGWYYLINGKGEPLRWARGFGGILYALVQHGLFNGAATLINLVPPSVGQFLSVMIVPGVVPVAIADVLFMVFDGLIFVVLVYVTGRLRQSNTISPYVDRPPQPYLFPQQSPAVAAVGGVR
jgi:RsiW-degrading membrane proteinase PrsW (M82 family)